MCLSFSKTANMIRTSYKFLVLCWCLTYSVTTGASAAAYILDREVTEVAHIAYVPVLFGATLINTSPLPTIMGHPNLLEIARIYLKDAVPCLSPFVLDQPTVFYNSMVYPNDSYSECVLQNITGPDLCLIQNRPVDCLFPILVDQFGRGLASILTNTSLDVLKLYDCGTDPGVPPLNLISCEGLFLLSYTEFLDCLHDSHAFQTLIDYPGSWMNLYREQASKNFSTICSVGEDIKQCITQTYKEISELFCANFLNYLQEQLESILGMLACGNDYTGADVLKCLGNPALFGNGPAPSLDTCLNAFILSLNESPKIANFTKISDIIAPVVMKIWAEETCQPLSDLVSCTQGVLNIGSCDATLQGLDHLFGPMHYAYNNYARVCELRPSEFPQTWKDSIERCRCLEDLSLKTSLLGQCNDTDLQPETATLPPGSERYITTLIIQQPWSDIFSRFRQCSDLEIVNDTCLKVFDSMEKYTLDFQFLGFSPTAADQIAVLFEATINMTWSSTVSLALNQLVRSGYIGSVPVSQSVHFILLSEMKLAVRPVAGPQSGGTPVTITGYFPNLQPSVLIGTYECNIDVMTPALIICLTKQLNDSSLLRQGLNITIQGSSGSTRLLDFLFTYTSDPVIDQIVPLNTILKGGVQLTISGSGLNAARRRIMLTTVTERETKENVTYETTCTGDLPEVMFCRTPLIDLEEITHETELGEATSPRPTLDTVMARVRRQATVATINEIENINVEVAFVFDGVENYLQPFRNITVYADPIIFGFKPPSRTVTFTSTWPISEKYLEITGKMLTDGIAEDGYSIMVGVADCKNIIVKSTLIVCEPPSKRPEVAEQDYEEYNKIPVKVLYASEIIQIGYLSYVQTIWEYLPGRYTILAAIFILLLIAALLTMCITYKRMQIRNRQSLGKRNLVGNMTGSDRKSYYGSSFYIPRGTRQTSYYSRTLSSVSIPSYRGQPRW